MPIIYNLLHKTHKIWKSFLPSFFRAYKLPTGGNVYLDITESPMMLSRIFGKFEQQKHMALDYFLSRGDSFIDIGSNKGEFAIHASLIVGSEGMVVGFEPEPKNCSWIRKSINTSKVDNMVLEELAVGKQEDVMSLFIGKKSGWNTLVPSVGKKTTNESVQVRICSLDKYLEDKPIRNLKAIKIDVEGFEKEVLLGATNTLNSTPDLVLFIDIHPSHGVKHDEIYQILWSHGFSLFHERYPYDIPVHEDEFPLEVIALKQDTHSHKIGSC